MLSRKDEFVQFVGFNTLHNFTKTHASFCGGKFVDVWSSGCITKKRCAACGAVAFVDTRVLNRGMIEGYIRRVNLGLEPSNRKPDGHEFKFNNHCVSCGQWFKDHKERDVCNDCSNISSGESGLDYDKFYHDSIEFWQGGQKHEVGSAGDRPAKPSFTKTRPSVQVMLLHIHGWLFEGINQREMLHRLGEWWGVSSLEDTMYINSMLVRGQNTMPAGWSPA
jgi:hypothetical protein